MEACICGLTVNNKLFSAGHYDIVQCLNCSQVRVVKVRKSRKKQLYNKVDVRVYIDKEKTFRSLFRQIVTFIKLYKPSGSLIDIGAGVGLLVDEAKRAGFEAIGYEPSSAGVEAARKYFGIRLHKSLFNGALVKRKVDIIIINHVLEHMQNPDKIIREINDSLKLDGLLVIGVPNFNSVMSHLKQDRWQNLIPEQHRWQFTIKTLDKLVAPYGFIRKGLQSENHDRVLHPLWKRTIYAVLDHYALLTRQGEAILVAYTKRENNSN